VPEASNPACPAPALHFATSRRIASRVGQLLYELLLEPLIYPSTLLLLPHNTFNHSGCLAHTPPPCHRNHALTTKTTSQKCATQTSSHHRPILPNFLTFLALVSLAGNIQVQAMRRDWQESNLSISRRMQSWACPLIWWASLACSTEMKEVIERPPMPIATSANTT